MERMLKRKPLYPAEKQAKPAIVCVTGGIGYIGCCVVARLLAAGHTVHATWRPCEALNPAAAAIQRAVSALPGADERLRWFAADLMDEGSYDEAIAGCTYVIHTASPVATSLPKKHAYSRMIGPAIYGVRNVLGSVDRAGSVEKVVMTSSLAAVMGAELPSPGHVYTEADNNLDFLQKDWAYFTAKTMSEWEAWAIAGQQKRWRLVTLCPGNVVGPPVVPNYKSESMQSVVKLMDGSEYPFVAPVGLPPTCDINDVAAAHVLAISIPAAQGRYLLSERGVDLPTIAAMLRDMYPHHRIPHITLPAWLLNTILRLTGQTGVADLVQAAFHTRPVDCTKIQRDLGLTFTPLEQSLQDTMEALMQAGLVPCPPAAAAGVEKAH